MTGPVMRSTMALLVWSMAYNMALPFLPLLAADLGATPAQVGYLQGAAYVGAALGLIPAGWLADRYGRRVTVAVAWLVGALGTALLVSAGTWTGLFPGAFLMLAGAGAMPALAALAIESAAEDRRRRVMSLFFAAAPGGLLLGSSIAGVIAEHAGLRTLMGFAAALAVASVLPLVGRMGPATAAAVSESAAPGDANASGGKWLPLLLLSVPAGLAYMLISLPAGFMTPYLRDVAGMSLSATGVTNAQLAVGQLAWSALFSVWPKERGRWEVRLGPISLRPGRGTLLALTVCLAANAAFGLLFPLGRTAPVLAALLLRGALFSLQPLGMTLVSEVTGSSGGMASRFSLLALVIGLATAGAPVVAGRLYTWHPAWPFQVAGIGAGVGTLALLGVMAIARPAPEGESA